MDCKKIKNKLFFLAEGSLKKDEETEIHEHLISCPACMKQYELFSDFETILQEEKQSAPDDFFYSRLTGRMERTLAPEEETHPQPTYLRLAHILIVIFIMGIAAFSGFTLAEKNSQYLGTSQSSQQSSDQSDIVIEQEQLGSNFLNY